MTIIALLSFRLNGAPATIDSLQGYVYNAKVQRCCASGGCESMMWLKATYAHMNNMSTDRSWSQDVASMLFKSIYPHEDANARSLPNIPR